MLFTIYLSRLAGPCQRWLAGGGRAAAELPCPGHSHGDTDGDRTPRVDCVVGTEAGGPEPARQPRLHVLQASPKGKALLLCLPCCHGLLLCSVPRASPAGTNQPLYATSRRSGPAPGPEQAPRTAFRSGARPTPPLPTSGRELPQPHHPVPVPNTSGLRPAPRGAALAHPTPSSCAVFLPRTVFLPLPRCLRWSRVEWGCPCHGPRCHGTVTTPLHPTEGMSIALATRAPAGFSPRCRRRSAGRGVLRPAGSERCPSLL